ncbi:MAG TPA: TadE/TadG family type IV pilus assembly protein [Solirubrobacteraceae bacterium]|nr:TadE/TadG family type IV pilus assembly protein [Solirubrobacteraceae bacterium]
MSHRLLLAANEEDVARRAAALAGEGEELEVVEVVTELDRVPRALRRTEPDVLVLHDSRGTLPAFQRTRELTAAFPEVGIVVVAAEVTPEALRAGMQAGARDVVGLPLALEDLEAAVRAAATHGRTLRERVVGESEAAAAGGLAGRIVVVAGAKGGVGTSTIALHLALTAVAARPDRPVCLVDLDLQAGDLSALLDIPPRRSIVDLAEVAHELSYRHLSDTVYGHGSGLSVLPAPHEGERAEEVTIEAARNVLGALRTRHDLVVVDAGAYVYEATGAAYELADRMIVVATPDGPALRGARRLLELWERLEVTPGDTRLLVNRVSRKVDLQPSVAREYVPAPVLDTTIPAAFGALEHATNTGVPDHLEDRRVREAFRELLDELDVLPEVADEAPVSARRRSGFMRRLAGDEGQSAVEMVGLLPVLAVVVLGMWQLGLIGYTYFAAGHAAREGARALATGEEEAEQVREDVPGAWEDGLRCEIGDDRVKVSLAVPVVLPGVDSPWRIASSAGTTVEDQPVAAPGREPDSFKPKRRKDDPCNDAS